MNNAEFTRHRVKRLVTFTKHEDLILNLYTNTIPFDTGYGPDNKVKLIPVGSTFAMIAVNGGGYLLKPPKSTGCEFIHVMPEIFNAAFKEVELTE